MSFEEFSSFFASPDSGENASSNPQDYAADGAAQNRETTDPFSSFNQNEGRPRDGEERDGEHDYARNSSHFFQKGRRYGEQRPYSNDPSYTRRNDYARSRRAPESLNGDAHSRKYSKSREYDRGERRTSPARYNGQLDYERSREQFKRPWHDQRLNDEGKSSNFRVYSDRRSFDSLKDNLKQRRQERDERTRFRNFESDVRTQPRRLNANKRFTRHGEGFSLAEASLRYKVRPSRLTSPESSESSTNIESLELSSLELVKRARRTSDRSERFAILQALRDKIRKASVIYGEGVLETLSGGYGFLRNSSNDFVTTADDVYVSPNQILQLKLRPGSVIRGQIRPPKGQEKNFALLRVVSIDGLAPNEAKIRPSFSDLVARRATKRLRLTQDNEDGESNAVQMRMIENASPICLGQRTTLVAPSCPEAQSFFYDLVSASLASNPEIAVVIALYSANPTEVKAQFNDPRCEVVSSFASSDAWWKVHVANLAFERAKRLVESGRDVVVFCDSFDLLSSAWKEENATPETWKRPWNEPIQDASPKSLLGLARNIEDGGSLTVVTATQPVNGNVPADLEGVVDAAIFFDPATGTVDIEKSFSLSKTETPNSVETQNLANETSC